MGGKESRSPGNRKARGLQLLKDTDTLTAALGGYVSGFVDVTEYATLELIFTVVLGPATVITIDVQAQNDGVNWDSSTFTKAPSGTNADIIQLLYRIRRADWGATEVRVPLVLQVPTTNKVRIRAMGNGATLKVHAKPGRGV